MIISSSVVKARSLCEPFEPVILHSACRGPYSQEPCPSLREDPGFKRTDLPIYDDPWNHRHSGQIQGPNERKTSVLWYLKPPLRPDPRSKRQTEIRFFILEAVIAGRSKIQTNRLTYDTWNRHCGQIQDPSEQTYFKPSSLREDPRRSKRTDRISLPCLSL